MGEDAAASSPVPDSVTVQRETAMAEAETDDEVAASAEDTPLSAEEWQEQLRQSLQGALPGDDEESQLLVESFLAKAAGFEAEYNEFFASTVVERVENDEDFNEATQELQAETPEFTEEQFFESLEAALTEEDEAFQTELAESIKEADQVILEALALRLEEADDEFLEALAETILDADVEFPEGEYLTPEEAAQELELLAREMYSLMGHKMAHDRERQGGRYAGRLPW